MILSIRAAALQPNQPFRQKEDKCHVCLIGSVSDDPRYILKKKIFSTVSVVATSEESLKMLKNNIPLYAVKRVILV